LQLHGTTSPYFRKIGDLSKLWIRIQTKQSQKRNPGQESTRGYPPSPTPFRVRGMVVEKFSLPTHGPLRSRHSQVSWQLIIENYRRFSRRSVQVIRTHFFLQWIMREFLSSFSSPIRRQNGSPSSNISFPVGLLHPASDNFVPFFGCQTHEIATIC